jgi:hypothetical protein
VPTSRGQKGSHPILIEKPIQTLWAVAFQNNLNFIISNGIAYLSGGPSRFENTRVLAKRQAGIADNLVHQIRIPVISSAIISA